MARRDPDRSQVSRSERDRDAWSIFGFFNEIGIISQLSSTAFERALPSGMSMAQFGVLNHFARLGGEYAPARLAAAFQVTRGAMTNTLQRLEANGWVSIRSDPEDGRRKRVKLTAKGRRAREKAIAQFMPTLLELTDGLSLSELAKATPLLQRVRSHLDAARNPQDFGESSEHASSESGPADGNSRGRRSGGSRDPYPRPR